jgi:hypothetical protein
MLEPLAGLEIVEIDAAALVAGRDLSHRGSPLYSLTAPTIFIENRPEPTPKSWGAAAMLVEATGSGKAAIIIVEEPPAPP